MAVVRKSRTPAPAPVVEATQPDPAPSDNMRVRLGGNNPPAAQSVHIDDEGARGAFDQILNDKEGFRERIINLIAAADRAIATDAESAGRCGELVKQIRAADRFVSDAHTTAKAPYLLAGRAIDAAKNEITGPLAVAKTKVEGKQTQFLREEQARRDAQARRQREEEERLRREAYEREQKAARQQAADEPEAPPVVVEPPAPVIVAQPEREIIRGDFGAAVSGRKEWVGTVVDFDLAYISVSENENVRAAISKAVSNLVRGGMRKIDGVQIVEQLRVSNR